MDTLSSGVILLPPSPVSLDELLDAFSSESGWPRGDADGFDPSPSGICEPLPCAPSTAFADELWDMAECHPFQNSSAEYAELHPYHNSSAEGLLSGVMRWERLEQSSRNAFQNAFGNGFATDRPDHSDSTAAGAGHGHTTERPGDSEANPWPDQPNRTKATDLSTRLAALVEGLETRKRSCHEPHSFQPKASHSKTCGVGGSRGKLHHIVGNDSVQADSVLHARYSAEVERDSAHFPISEWSAHQGRRRRRSTGSASAKQPRPAIGMRRASCYHPGTQDVAGEQSTPPLPSFPSDSSFPVSHQDVAVRGAEATASFTYPSSLGSMSYDEDLMLQGRDANAAGSGTSSSTAFTIGPLVLQRHIRVIGQSGFCGQSAVASPGSLLKYALAAGPSASLAEDPSLLPPRPSDPGLRRMAREQLLALAEAHATDQPLKVRVLTEQLQRIAATDGSATKKIVHGALLALELRRSGNKSAVATLSNVTKGLKQSDIDAFAGCTGWGAFVEMASTHTLLRALAGQTRPHLILLNDSTRLCWPALLGGLAAQPGGPPLSLRVTAVNFIFPFPLKEEDGDAGGHAVGRSLQSHCTSTSNGSSGSHCSPSEAEEHLRFEQLRCAAAEVGIPVVLRRVRVPHTSFHPSMVAVDSAKEAVAVVSCWTLMVFPDSSVLRSNPRNALLRWIHSLSPVAFVLFENDADLNSPFFLFRFRELLDRGVVYFEALDSLIPRGAGFRSGFEFLFSSDLINCIACEGLDRFLRMERMEQWQDRMKAVGFEAMAFPPNVWGSLGLLGRMDRRLEVVRDGEVARLQWCGVPHLFGSAWVPC